MATFPSERPPLVRPAVHDLRRVPTPVHPHSLLWHAGNPHPALTALRAHLASRPSGRLDTEVRTPPWALRSHPRDGGTRS